MCVSVAHTGRLQVNRTSSLSPTYQSCPVSVCPGLSLLLGMSLFAAQVSFPFHFLPPPAHVAVPPNVAEIFLILTVCWAIFCFFTSVKFSRLNKKLGILSVYVTNLLGKWYKMSYAV